RSDEPGAHRVLRRARDGPYPQTTEHERTRRLDRDASDVRHRRGRTRRRHAVPRHPAEEGAGHRGVPQQVHAQVLMFFLGLIYRLREQDVSVGITEALGLAAALKAGAHDDTVRGFYYAARATLIHHEGHLDAFDRAFLAEYGNLDWDT